MKGRILKEYITQGLFQEHAKSCLCKICCGENVDMLKQEGEMALAAKRRRLSQADSHHNQQPTRKHTDTIITASSSITTVANTIITTSTNTISSTTVTTKAKRKTPIKLDPVDQKDSSPNTVLPAASTSSTGSSKIWSPSGGIINYNHVICTSHSFNINF